MERLSLDDIASETGFTPEEVAEAILDIDSGPVPKYHNTTDRVQNAYDQMLIDIYRAGFNVLRLHRELSRIPDGLREQIRKEGVAKCREIRSGWTRRLQADRRLLRAAEAHIYLFIHRERYKRIRRGSVPKEINDGF